MTAPKDTRITNIPVTTIKHDQKDTQDSAHHSNVQREINERRNEPGRDPQ